MKFNIISRRITLSDSTTEYIQKKLAKLDKFFGDESEARIVVGAIKDREYVEASIYAGGMIYRAEVTEVDAKTAVDKIVDVIERQIRRNKTKLSKKIKREALADDTLISGESYIDSEEADGYRIVKTKRFAVKPMNPEEAVLQMRLLGHSFFIFKNVDTGEMNVVYRRKDGNYALIESID